MTAEPTPRLPIAAANWKMNMLKSDAEAYCDVLTTETPPTIAAEVLICPPFPLLHYVAGRFADHPSLACGGQDLHPRAAGAHTGDVSGPQVADAGCRWVLVGHSERRQDHQESDELIGEKVAAAREHGLLPMICVGETGEQRNAGETHEVLARQLRAALTHRPVDFELAYEPVWAIGTGDTASPAQAQEAHVFLREQLAQLVGRHRAEATRILYGGSVNPQNAPVLIAEKDIDGFLVGGAALDSSKFLAIIRACGGVD